MSLERGMIIVNLVFGGFVVKGCVNVVCRLCSGIVVFYDL